MDPFYFMDLNIKKKNDDNNNDESDIELQDMCDYSPCGSWIIGDEDYKIIYKNNEYDIIKFNNNNKIITFYNNQQAELQLKITLKDIKKTDNNIELFSKLIDIIDNNKQNMTNNTYINIMNTLQNEYNNSL